VPDEASASEREQTAKTIKKLLDDNGLQAEFVAPRLWEDARGIDGPVTSNNANDRQWALDRGKRALMSREYSKRTSWCGGRRAKAPIHAKARMQSPSFTYMLEWTNALLDYDKNLQIMGEMKPNEPMDLMYLPTTGHFLALAYKTVDPSRVGVLIESAHAILAGLDPSDEFAYAAFHDKLWGVHLNDQNGLKYDQDKAFGAVDLRRAFNQVDVLVRHSFGQKGEIVGLDVKAMRTQPADKSHLHLQHSMEVFTT
jgi:xylose isomerase